MVEIDTKEFAELCGDGWNAGDTKPEMAGYYLRQFTDGEFRQYFDGEKWFGVRFETDEILNEHWRQVGDYSCWRAYSVGMDESFYCVFSGKEINGVLADIGREVAAEH